MKKALAMILSLAMLLSLAACGGSPETSETSGNQGTVVDVNAPTNVTIGLSGEPNTLDPEQGGGIPGIYETLFSNDADLNQINKLATGYEWEDDNTLVITIRDDVVFHNGNAFTASDVLFSLQVCADNPQMSNRVANIDVAASSARDDYTVELKTYGYSAVLTNYLCTVIMLDEEWYNEVGGDMDQICNGSGPYMLGEWKMGESMTLLRNENYWGDPAAFETVTIRYFTDSSTAFMEFETGNLDVCAVENAEDVAVMQGGTVDGYLSSVLRHHVTVISMSTLVGDTFQNENLRQAIAHAIDIDSMITSICGDMAIPATSLMPSDDATHIDVPFEYDPEAAAGYVEAYKAETGATEIVLDMVLDNEGYNPDIAEAIQYYLSEVGITVNIETCMKFDLIPRMIAGEINFTLNSIGGGADPNDLFMALERGSGNSSAEFTDDTLCDLIEDGKSEKDAAARTEIYQQIQQLNRDGAWAIPLYEPVSFFAVKDGFAGVSIDPVDGQNLNIAAIYYAG